MADVEIRFLGDANEAEHAVADLDRALEVLGEIIDSVQRALGDLKISSGTVARIQSEAAVINRALESVEDQAKETARALSMQEMAAMGGPSLTMIGSAVRGIPFVGYPGPRPTDRSGYASPLSGVQSYTPPPPPPPPQPRMLPYALGANDPETNPGLAAALAYLAGGHGGGGGGGGMGLLAAAGWGRGGFRIPLPFFGPFGMRGGIRIPGAGFGSALGLAGFGAERLLGSTLGIAGSMGGALAGGGAYALGALGTAAVGMGTDMAGIGQAAGDIKIVSGDLSKLNQAIAQYGKGSREAAAAQAQLNLDLKGFSPVARLAVLQAAKASEHLKTMFDYFTGPAERRGAHIITQGIQTGQAFLPTIGKYAFENMGIIQQGLQPLFGWLKQTQTGGQLGGLGIFKDLERIFQKQLPTAVHAGSQAFEVFLHAVDDAAHHTGGFMKTLDSFFTKINTPGGLARMDQEIANLIGLFHSWMNLLGAVGKLVFDLFKPAVGLGQDFADQMTRLVNLTRRWVEASGTQNVLHSLFAAHKDQLDAIFKIIRALSPILFATISAFAQVEAVVTRLTVGPLKVLADLIAAITKHPLADKILGWAAAILLVDRGLTTLLTYLKTLTAAWGLSGAAAVASAAETDAALASEGAAADATTAQVGILKTAFLALGGQSVLSGLAKLAAGIVGLLGPIAAAAAAVYALDKLINKLTGFDALKKVWGTAGFGADDAGSRGAHAAGGADRNPYQYGTNNWFEYEAGYRGFSAGHHGFKDSTGVHSGNVVKDAAYKQGQKARHAGSGGGSSAGGNASIVSEAKAYGVGSGGTYQWGGGHSGVVQPGAKLDCSGYVWQVFTAAGFKNFPGGSVAQWEAAYGTNWGANHVNPSEAQPGDVVFSVGGDPPSPGHVGIITSGRGGGAKVMQYYSKGKPPDTVSLGSIADLVGIKRFFLVKRGAEAGGAGNPKGYNPGGKGYNPGSTKVPGAHTGAAGAQLPINLQTAIDKAATTKGTHDDIVALDDAIAFVHDRIAKLVHAHASLKKLDPWYQLLAQLQGSRRGIGGAPVHPQHATSASRLTGIATGHGLIHQIQQALNPAYLLGGTAVSPDNIMSVHTLETAQAKWDPLLKGWLKKIEQFDKELHDKLLSPKTVADIKARMDLIQKHITDALGKLRTAAQTQLQAAQTAWSAFTQAFDSSFQGQGGQGNSSLISQLQGVLGKEQLAVNLDAAQSKVLGGKPDTTMAQQVIDAVGQVIATVNGKSQPYTQQQIDNWLQLWGDYYARKGYTPQQMYDAFNKLLASVGLPPIDNPFDTGGLPLPPGSGGTAGAGGTGTGPGAVPGVGAGGPISPFPVGWNTPARRQQHHASRTHHPHHPKHHVRVSAVHAGGAHHPVSLLDSHTGGHDQAPVHIEIKYEKGLEWLDDHVKVLIDGKLVDLGRKSNHRARSGRH